MQPAPDPASVTVQGGQARIRVLDLGAPVVERTPLSHDDQIDDTPPREVPSAWEHPHLVKVLDVQGRRRGELLAFVPGGSVSALLADRGPLPVGEAVTLLVPVARALAHLHRHGAVHGDVSPENVLFDAQGAPMLVDPGLARALGESLPDGGTDGFCAPESPHGAAADVYGWAALAWFVITGETPADERRRVPLPLLRPEAGAAMGQLIEDCLAADPERRPPASEIGRALLDCHDPVPLDATAAAGGDGVAMLRTRTTRSGPLRRLVDRLAGYLGAARDASAGRAPAPRRRRGLRAATVTLGGAAAVLAAVAAAAAFGGVGDAGGAGRRDGDAHVGGTAPPGADARAEAVAALPELDRKRTEALASRDAEGLEAVYVDGEGLDADRELIAGLKSRGTHFASLTSRLQRLRPDGDADGGRLRIRASSVTTGVEIPLSQEAVPGSGSRERVRDVVFSLVRAQDGWRIETVVGEGE